MTNFSVGDKVECIEPVDDLVRNKVYTVLSVRMCGNGEQMVYLDTTRYGGYYSRRFVVAKTKGFQKEQLKTGMRVVLRDGRTFIVMKGVAMLFL